MKKQILLLIYMIIICISLVGCGGNENAVEKAAMSDPVDNTTENATEEIAADAESTEQDIRMGIEYYTLDEILTEMNASEDYSQIFIKNGDEYRWPTYQYYYMIIGADYSVSLKLSDIWETMPCTVNLSEGEEIVYFTNNNIGSTDKIDMYQVIEQFTCVPIEFSWNEEGKYLECPFYASHSEFDRITEIDGAAIDTNPLYKDHLVGEPLQPVILGGYSGSQYVEYESSYDTASLVLEFSYIGNTPYVPLDLSIPISTGERTKDGYITLINNELNALETGGYLIDGAYIYISDEGEISAFNESNYFINDAAYDDNVNNAVEFDDAIALNCPNGTKGILEEGTGSFAFEQEKETFAGTSEFVANSSQLTVVTCAGISDGNSIFSDGSMLYQVELYEVIDNEEVFTDYYIGSCDLVEGGVTFFVNQNCIYRIVVRVIDCPNNTKVSGHGHIYSISAE